MCDEREAHRAEDGHRATAIGEIPVYVRADQAARFEKVFPSPPSDELVDGSGIGIELAGAPNERGIVPSVRIIRNNKYAKVFVTIHNRGTNETGGEVSVKLRKASRYSLVQHSRLPRLSRRSAPGILCRLGSECLREVIRRGDWYRFERTACFAGEAPALAGNRAV